MYFVLGIQDKVEDILETSQGRINYIVPNNEVPVTHWSNYSINQNPDQRELLQSWNPSL